jgi:sulfide:quinone oxidoreductase
MPPASRTRTVLIAGGGVAALEACLALRAFLPEESLRIEILCPVDRFQYRPLAVLEPFDGTSAWFMDLGRFAADQDVHLVRDALVAVEPYEHVVVTATGKRLEWDRLLVAIGAEPVRSIPGAVTFRGGRDADAVRNAVDAVDIGSRLAFVAPPGTFWTLPLYELALLAAARLGARGRNRLLVVTPEDAPLQAFGRRASETVQALLDDHGIRFSGPHIPVAADAGEIEFADGGRVRADAVIALPRLRGPRVAGLPRDDDGFVPVDDTGRVPGCEGTFAAGDLTDFPLKQGGLAAQQADAAAETILAELGFPIVPRPFSPVLEGVLYTGGAPAYLRAAHGESVGAPRAYSLWWPPSKIAGRYLSPYLTIRAGAPRAPEVRPDADIVPVSVDISEAVRGIRSVLGAAPVPPG